MANTVDDVEEQIGGGGMMAKLSNGSVDPAVQVKHPHGNLFNSMLKRPIVWTSPIVLLVLAILLIVLIGGIAGGVVSAQSRGGSQSQLNNTAPTSAPTRTATRSPTALGIAFTTGMLPFESGTLYGAAVAVSGDGTVAAVSAEADGGNGAVYLYVRNTTSGKWFTAATSRIRPSDCKANTIDNQVIGCFFGRSLAVNFDGSVIVVGGPSDNYQGQGAAYGFGAAWVFNRTGPSTWTQFGNKIVPPGITNHAGTGTCVGISGDGSTILVGARGEGTDEPGAVFAYFRGQGAASYSLQSGKLVGSVVNGTFVQVGDRCDLSGDGSTAAAGGSGDSDFTGAVWVFNRQGTTWSQQAKLQAPGADGAGQGDSVSLTNDGNTLAVGTASSDHIFIWKRSGSVWNQLFPNLVPNAGKNTIFGRPVALSGDGSTLFVAAPDNTAGGDPGCITVFKSDVQGNFVFHQGTCNGPPDELTPVGLLLNTYGYSMSISDNGQHGVASAWLSAFESGTGLMGFAFTF